MKEQLSKPCSLIVGQGPVPVQCADILLKSGHAITAVCSPDSPLRDWAERQNVGHFSELSGFVIEAAKKPIDYIFSIINFVKLPESLLSLPRHLAVNYHDAPLPRYAGSYATTWAILNGEKMHGVSWHAMTERVDTGDILKQASVTITDTETSYSLNQKCYFAAMRTFSALVVELANDTYRRIPQDLSQRTFFGRSKRPDNDCLIDPAWSAERIDRFCRALDFGPTTSPFGKPRIHLGAEVYTVDRAVQTDSVSGVAPGTLLESREHHIRIATGTADVVLMGLTPLLASTI